MKKENIKKDNSLSVSSQLKKRWTYLIFLIAFLTYANTITFEYACDDNMYTTENTFVQKGISAFPDLISKGTLYGFNGTNIGDYRPVVLINFALEKSLFGNSPKAGHFFNVLIYALLCVFLFRFLLRLFKDYPLYISILITVLFILHPIHTEVVANIKSRDELLCMLFGILSLDLVYKYYGNKNVRLLIFSGIFFFISIMSKENGFSYLGLIPLVLYFFTNATFRQIFLLTIPFIVVTGIAYILRMSVLDSNQFTKPFEVWQNSLMAATNLPDQLATIFTMLLHALYLLFLPITLSWDYSFNHFPIVHWTNMKAILSIVIYIFLAVVAISGFRKKSIYSFAILFYFITYFITSNLVLKIGTSFADRFLFSPSLAFCIALPFLLFKLFRIDSKNTSLQGARNIITILTIVSVLYAFRTIDRNSDWKDNKTLHASGLETAPNSAWVHYIYAIDFEEKVNAAANINEKNDAAKIALDEFQKSININPGFLIAYYEKGSVYKSIGDFDNATKMFKKSLELKPDFADAQYDYGTILFLKKDYTTALDYFIKATENNPKNGKAFLAAGACYRSLFDYKNAITYFEKALQFVPGNYDLIQNISVLCKAVGDTAKANYYASQISPH